MESNRKIAGVDKSGFASLPENMQKMVINAIYLSVTNEEKVLVALLKRGSVSEKLQPFSQKNLRLSA